MKEIGVSIESKTPSAIVPFSEELNVKIEETLEQDFQELVSADIRGQGSKEAFESPLNKKKVTYIGVCAFLLLF